MCYINVCYFKITNNFKQGQSKLMQMHYLLVYQSIDPVTCFFPWYFAVVLLLPHHALCNGVIGIMYFISMVITAFFLLSYKALLVQAAFSPGL